MQVGMGSRRRRVNEVQQNRVRAPLRSACAKAVMVATALVPGAVLTSVVRISVVSASLPGVREPTLRERPALAALLG
jgi:hypothetical protein